MLGLSIFLWVGGAMIEKWLQLPVSLLSSATVAILAVALLSVEELIDWNDLKGVNWGIIFVIGAGLTLGDALDKSGASAWIVSLVEPLLGDLPYIAVLALLVISTFALTHFMNSVTYGAILSPILVTLGVSSGIAPPPPDPALCFYPGALLHAAQLVGSHDPGRRLRRRRFAQHVAERPDRWYSIRHFCLYLFHSPEFCRPDLAVGPILELIQANLTAEDLCVSG